VRREGAGALAEVEASLVEVEVEVEVGDFPVLSAAMQAPLVPTLKTEPEMLHLHLPWCAPSQRHSCDLAAFEQRAHVPALRPSNFLMPLPSPLLQPSRLLPLPAPPLPQTPSLLLLSSRPLPTPVPPPKPLLSPLLQSARPQPLPAPPLLPSLPSASIESSRVESQALKIVALPGAWSA